MSDFVRTDSGRVSDGGLCLVPEDAQSEEMTYEHRPDKSFTLPQAEGGVVYGSVSVELLAPDGVVLLEVPEAYLHGHEHLSRYSVQSLLDYATGAFHDRRLRFAREAIRQLGQDAAGTQGRNCKIRVTYRVATSAARLERFPTAGIGGSGTVPNGILNVSWFGIEPGVEDCQPALCHVTNVARRLRAEGQDIHTILFPERGSYSYAGAVAWPDGVALVGQGGTELVTDTLDVTHTAGVPIEYRPVRIVDNPTTLRVGDGLLDFPGSGTLKDILFHAQTAIYTEPGLMSVALRDLVLDGNWSGNQDALATMDNTAREKLRNSPAYAGFVATDHGGVDIPEGQAITVENVAVQNYGSQGLLGNPRNTWTGRNIRLGGNGWNHSIYGAEGTFTNLTLAGPAWCHAITYDSQIENLVYEGGDERMDGGRTLPDLINIRGSRGGTLTVDGGMLNFDGSPFRIGFSPADAGLVLKNLVVIPSTRGLATFVQGRRSPLEIRLENVTFLEPEGTQEMRILNAPAEAAATVTDWTILPALPYTPEPPVEPEPEPEPEPSEIEVLRAELDAARAVIAEMTADVQRLERDLSDAYVANEHLAQDKRALESALSEAQTALAAAETRASEAEGRAAAAEAEAVALRAVIEAVRDAVGSARPVTSPTEEF